jgi:hypothetical protein
MLTHIDSLAKAYETHLGGVLAISPELYGRALDAIAQRLGRQNDEAFRVEVRAHEKTLPCYLD